MSWLDRQSFLGADSERRLADVTILIAGLGAGQEYFASFWDNLVNFSFITIAS